MSPLSVSFLLLLDLTAGRLSSLCGCVLYDFLSVRSLYDDGLYCAFTFQLTSWGRGTTAAALFGFFFMSLSLHDFYDLMCEY